MTDRQENPYKGYHIVTSSSGGTNPPYTATFGIAEAQPDGTIGPSDTQYCGTMYQTAHEAHAAANVAARAFIDSMLANQHCQKFGRVARIHLDQGHRVTFDCIKP